MNHINPTFEWYSKISDNKGLLPRCPFRSVYRCPKYYRVSASRSSDSAEKWSKYKVDLKDMVRVLNTQLTGRWS